MGRKAKSRWPRPVQPTRCRAPGPRYQYGVNNFGLSSVSPSQGEYDTTITYDHALIPTQDDIQFNILWDDMGDNDGVRPESVRLVLYANGKPVSEWTEADGYHNAQNRRSGHSRE